MISTYDGNLHKFTDDPQSHTLTLEPEFVVFIFFFTFILFLTVCLFGKQTCLLLQRDRPSNNCSDLTITVYCCCVLPRHQAKSVSLVAKTNAHTDGRSIVRVAQQYFWSRVRKWATRRLELMARNEQIAEAEVGQLHRLGFIEEDNVLGFQVSMNDMQLVTVCYCTHNLHDNKHGKLQDLLHFNNIKTAEVPQ